MKITAIQCNDTVHVPGPELKPIDTTAVVTVERHGGKGVTMDEVERGVMLRNGRSAHLVPWATIRTVIYEQTPEVEEPAGEPESDALTPLEAAAASAAPFGSPERAADLEAAQDAKTNAATPKAKGAKA